MQNAYIERFNKTYQEGIMDVYIFDDMEEIKEVTAVWLEDYNAIRPQDALDGVSPRHYQHQHYQDNHSNESVYF